MAPSQARERLAVARGLLLDLLATEDREEVNQADEAYLKLVGHPTERPASERQNGPGRQ